MKKILAALLLVSFFLIPACAQPTTPPPPAESTLTTTRIHDIRPILYIRTPIRPNPVKPSSPQDAESLKLQQHARQSLIDQITNTIQSTIDPPSWQNPNRAAIRELNGQLIILQTPANHAAIQQYLNQLLADTQTAITINSRVIEIDDATLQALQLELPPRSALNPNSQLRQILDPDQLASLTQKMGASKTSTIYSTPQITTSNNLRASAAITNQENLITSWSKNPDPSSDKPYLPTTQTLTTGTVLEVQPTLSPDARYITLKIKLSQSTLDSRDTTPAPNTPPDLNLTIQSPRLTRREMSGILLLVPLNHTALIAQPNPKTKTTTLLLLTPKVIIQKEEELRLFGPESPPNQLPRS